MGQIRRAISLASKPAFAREEHEAAAIGVAPMGHMAQGTEELALRQELRASSSQ
jgi:hypothetical protein